MKIAQLVEAAAGGTGRHVIDLTQALLERGHQVHLVYSHLRADEIFERDVRRLLDWQHFSVEPISLRRAPSPGDLVSAVRLRRSFRGNRFDIVHSHSTKAGLIGRMGMIGHSAKRVYSAHGFFTMDPNQTPLSRRMIAAAEATLARFCDTVITVSPEEFQHAREIGIAPEKLSLIPNGVALPVGRVLPENPAGDFDARREDLRRQWGLRRNEICIGFVGRLVPVKSPETMLQAFAALLGLTRTPVRLAMVGDGPLATRCHRLAVELGIAQRVVWLGERDARSLMPAFDIFTLTSDSEGHPMVVLEALANGLPVVATSVGGISTTVRHGLNGFAAPVRGSLQIAQHLAALTADPNLRLQMGRASRSIAGDFSLDQMVTRIEALYHRLIHGAPEPSAVPDLETSALR